ncbi:Hypothetical protein Cp106_0730 [Corynebacterium pseudotuberculosis 1/06-A]|nr:Hypothetical protein Cp106_0730 [Corynebacterium pseudotuberculosis 1/06-A]
MHSVKSLSPSARDLHILLKGHTDGGVQQLADHLPTTFGSSPSECLAYQQHTHR